MNFAALRGWCAAEQDWLLETIEALVRLESPSTDKAAVDRCGAELAARLTACGATVTRVAAAERGDHLLAEIAGDGAPLLLLGHFDTVWPVGQLSRMPLVHDHKTGLLHGPGVFDMKAGIAVSMLALRALADEPEGVPPVRMLWTTDEEIGSGTSRSLIESVARECRAVLVLEPSLPGGGAKTSRKGVGEFELIVHGVSAHAGLDPDKGASAIHELAHQILAIEALQDPARGITLNVGVVEGGTRTNVVADRARAAIDVRVPTLAAAAALTSKLAALRPRSGRTRLELRGAISRPPLERTAAVASLFEMAQSVARALGVELVEGSAGGGSDGNFTGAVGVPTLDGLGPRGDGAHALHEHVVVEDLPWRAAFLAALIRRISGRRVVQ
jgi:glutamate carboxypeptidase